MSAYSTATVAGFITYQEARGREVPGTWDDAKIAAALLVASEWVDSVYGPSFVGFKTLGFLQDREWPRTGAVTLTDPPYTFPNETIPDRVTSAVYEAAWREGNATGALNVDFSPSKYRRVSVDGAVSVEYSSVSFASDVQPQFSIIDQLLQPLLSVSGNMSAYSGAVGRA